MTKRAVYDDDELVADLTGASLTHWQIAAKHGISKSLVDQIALGDRRPELHRRIAAAAEARVDRSRRLGGRLAVSAMARLGAIIADGSGASPEIQRKACRFVELSNGYPVKCLC